MSFQVLPDLRHDETIFATGENLRADLSVPFKKMLGGRE